MIKFFRILPLFHDESLILDFGIDTEINHLHIYLLLR